MRIKELRIGNWVQYKKTNTVQVDLSDFCEFYNTRLLQYLEPIPLTEEWLIKFGFEKSIETGYENFPKYLNEVFTILNGVMEDGTFLVWKNKGIITHLKYVHQLQNLYFALTGEELTIKPKN